MISDQQFVNKIQRLEQALGYAFQNVEYLEQALTHRSYAELHNERMEFIGDAILGMIIGKELFDRFPKSPEGELTRMRSYLVRESALAEIARSFGVGDYLLLGPGELKQGGGRRESLVADAMEAIIGAIFLDCGEKFEVVRTILLKWYKDRLEVITPATSAKDPKSTLQELMQSQRKELPVYAVESVTGRDNHQIFEVSVVIDGLSKKCYGKGSSRRRAEQRAAQEALDRLSSENTEAK